MQPNLPTEAYQTLQTQTNNTSSQQITVNGKQKFKAFLHPINLSYYRTKRIATKFSIFKDNDKINNNNEDEKEKMFNDGTYKSLAQILKLAKKTQKIEISYSMYMHMKKNGSLHISESLKGLSAIRKIDIDFAISSNALGITETEMNIFYKALKNLTSLQSLSLNIWWHQKLTDDGVKSLCQTLKSLLTLKRFHLGIFGSAITNKAVKNIGKAVKTLVALEDLSLTFQLCQDLDGSEAQYLGQALQTLPALKKLDVSFMQSPITDVAIEGFSQGFKALTQLTSFDLDLMWCDGATDEGIQKLGQSLKNFVSLQNIRLNFWDGPRIADAGLQSLAESFESLTTLNTIDMSFTNCQTITDKSAFKFGEALGNLVLLQSINLDLRSCKTGDLAIEGLVKGLKHLVSLKNICFSFSSDLSEDHVNRYCEVTDTGMQQLGYLLRNSPNLQSISLRFSDYKSITNLGVKSLLQSLRNRTSLEIISFSFSDCKEITDGAVLGIDQVFYTLPSIKSISLDFSSCKVTDYAKQILRNSLMTLSFARKVEIWI